MDKNHTEYLDNIENLKEFFYNLDNQKQRDTYYHLLSKNAFRLIEDILSQTENVGSPFIIKTIGESIYLLYDNECKLYALNKIMLFLIELERYEQCEKLLKLKNIWKSKKQ